MTEDQYFVSKRRNPLFSEEQYCKIKKIFSQIQQRSSLYSVQLIFSYEKDTWLGRYWVDSNAIDINTKRIIKCNDEEIKEIIIHEFAHASFGRKSAKILHNLKFVARVKEMGGTLTGETIKLKLAT